MTTFETAKQLHEVGYPQPTIAFGQFWYNSEGHLFMVCHFDGSVDLAGVFLSHGQPISLESITCFPVYYCPTDAELIMALRFWQVTTRDVNDVQQYAVSHFAGDLSTKKNLVLSEALAEAYIDEMTPRPPIEYKTFRGNGFTATFEYEPDNLSEQMTLLEDIANFFKSKREEK